MFTTRNNVVYLHAVGLARLDQELVNGELSGNWFVTPLFPAKWFKVKEGDTRAAEVGVAKQLAQFLDAIGSYQSLAEGEPLIALTHDFERYAEPRGESWNLHQGTYRVFDESVETATQVIVQSRCLMLLGQPRHWRQHASDLGVTGEA
jgi:hypothetical protein